MLNASTSPPHTTTSWSVATTVTSPRTLSGPGSRISDAAGSARLVCVCAWPATPQPDRHRFGRRSSRRARSSPARSPRPRTRSRRPRQEGRIGPTLHSSDAPACRIDVRRPAGVDVPGLGCGHVRTGRNGMNPRVLLIGFVAIVLAATMTFVVATNDERVGEAEEQCRRADIGRDAIGRRRRRRRPGSSGRRP